MSFKEAFFQIYIIWNFFIESNTSVKCNHQPLKAHQIFTGNKLESSLVNIKTRRGPYSNLRIHFEYTESFTSYRNSKQLKVELLEPAKHKLQYLIKVKNPNNGNLRVERPCKDKQVATNEFNQTACMYGCSKSKCAGYDVPEVFLKKCKVMTGGKIEYTENEGSGVVGADIALIIHVGKCRQQTLAKAASCYLESELDRPILGILILCHGAIMSGENVLRNIAAIEHEIVHTLGFTVDKYAYYRFKDGRPIVERNRRNEPALGIDKNLGVYRWNSAIIIKVWRNRSNIHGTYNKTVHAFILPSVLEVARAHFNCSKLDGVDLEEYPRLSHFSEYAFYNELMTPESNGPMTHLSILTLALLEDTGWYKVTFHKVRRLSYGRNKGCGLILEGCYKYMRDRAAKRLSISPFCNDVYRYGNIFRCAKGRRYFHFCLIIKHTTLDKKYQYFKHLDHVPTPEVKFYAGSSDASEFCPFLHVTENPTSICSDTTNEEDMQWYNIVKSYYGKDSACFENAIINFNPRIRFGASCRKYTYDNFTKRLNVYFGTDILSCPSDSVYSFKAELGYIGIFKCPQTKGFNMNLYHEEEDFEKSIKKRRPGMKFSAFLVFLSLTQRIGELF